MPGVPARDRFLNVSAVISTLLFVRGSAAAGPSLIRNAPVPPPVLISAYILNSKLSKVPPPGNVDGHVPNVQPVQRLLFAVLVWYRILLCDRFVPLVLYPIQ